MAFSRASMVDPKHDCSGVSRPELELSDDGRLLFTTGVGLPILLGAVAMPNTTWFSSVAGEHGDETMVIATRLAIADPIADLPPAEGLVARFVGNQGHVDERELSSTIAEYFGTDLETLEPDETRYPETWTVTSHDEHWSTLYPIDAPVLRRVIRGVLRQIAFVAGRDIDWDGVSDKLLGILRPNVSLRLDARRSRLRQHVVAVGVQIPRGGRTLRERVLTKL
ncbi:MAG: hypothetical protein JOZ41_00455 [Chloroflexi bacterium]|nr:hypothetical protein [Chloroflexota bacterium]